MAKYMRCSLRALLQHRGKSISRFVVLLSGLCLLSACGFHLRDNYLINSKFHTLYLVSSDPYSPLTLALKDKLRRNNVTLVDAPSPNVPVFVLKSPSTSSRVVSVYSDGTDAESELSYTVSGTVTTADNQQYPISVQLHRDFTDDTEQALAKMREQQLIDKELSDMAAEQIIRQLATIH
ncbi:LPS-assembly lipoprotein LptE [Celerinatantimonas yamalensis]|uniref:LPS-assembly lipoprotein LptE n=1 Tax=Celerinatantimonas yamalensis TaxID=559956 RepID=A0ABW9GBB0_9GAMM